MLRKISDAQKDTTNPNEKDMINRYSALYHELKIEQSNALNSFIGSREFADRCFYSLISSVNFLECAYQKLLSFAPYLAEKLKDEHLKAISHSYLFAVQFKRAIDGYNNFNDRILEIYRDEVSSELLEEAKPYFNRPELDLMAIVTPWLEANVHPDPVSFTM